MSQNRPQVPRLATVAFYALAHEAFNRNGCFDAMVDFIYDYLYHLSLHRNGHSESPDNSEKLRKYRDLCKALVIKIIESDEMPKHISIDLAKFIFEYHQEVVQFSIFIASILTSPDREDMKVLCRCVVLRPDGTLDRPKSILNAVGANVAHFSPHYIASRFCVSPEKAIQEYTRRVAEGKPDPCSHAYANLSDPIAAWKLKETEERMGGLFYECVTIHGTRDALEYFFNDIDPAHRQILLSQGAACIEYHEIAADKILFFRRHMDPQAWRIVLKRFFYKIFCTIFKNYMYKHLCIDLYREVCEELEVNTIFSCVNALTTHDLCSFCEPLGMKLLVADLEPFFISLWLSIPAAHRKEIGNSIFNIYMLLLVHKKYDAVITLLKDEDAFTTRRRDELTACTVIFMLVNGQQDSILKLMEKITREAYDMDRIKNEVITADNLITYFAFFNGLYDITRYDNILRFKYTTAFSSEIAKRCLILNHNASNVLLEALRQGYVSPRRFEDFLYWVLDNDRVKVENYIRSRQHPPNLLTQIYKFYMTSTRESVYTIPAFRQSDEVTQKILRQIATDQELLYNYCFMLLESKDYAALPGMLTSVFPADWEREQFLLGFFSSTLGQDSVYRMLKSSAYRSAYYFRFVFRSKLNEFLEFKKYWILSPRIAYVLERVLNGSSRRQVDTEDENDNFDPMEVDTSLDMLPHESYELLMTVREMNMALFKYILRYSVSEEILHSLPFLRP